MTRAGLVALAVVATACTPRQLDQWSALLDIDVDPADPKALAIATDAWCQHGAALVDLVGPEAVDAMPPDPLPECLPAGWVDLGHGVAGPAHLVDIRACESTDDYGAVSPSGRYRGGYQFSRGTWDWTATTFAGRPDLVGADPASAAPADQDAMAVALYVAEGPGHWPVCGR